MSNNITLQLLRKFLDIFNIFIIEVPQHLRITDTYLLPLKK